MFYRYTLLLALLAVAALLPAQTTLSRFIVRTETVTDEDGRTFEASSDDAEQENDEIDALFDDDLDAGWEGEPDDQNVLTIGLRFQDITIPKNAIIDSAYIVVNSHEAKESTDVAVLTIYALADDNPPTFRDDLPFAGLPGTTARVIWTVNEPWGLWTYHRTPSLTSIVQEIVNRAGWNPGNAIAFILAGENQGPSDLENAREMSSFENIADPEDGGDGQNHPDRVPELRIVWRATSSVDNIADGYVGSRISPNPASSHLYVHFADAATAMAVQVQLFGLDGREMAVPVVRVGNDVRVVTESLPKGTYLLRASLGGQVYADQVVVR